MRHPFRGRKAARIGLFVVVALAIASAVVMLLWNALMPSLFGWHTLGYFQALGLLVLCRVLFGGMRRGGPPGPWGKARFEAWQRMSPEERSALRARWENCGHPAQDRNPPGGPDKAGPGPS